MAFEPGPAYVLGADALPALFQALLDSGHTVVAPTARDGVIALAAIGRQDRVFLDGAYAEPAYAERRRDALLVVAQCTEAHGTCFCASMGTGPRATAGFDLALTELLGGGRREILAEVGSERGAALLAGVPKRAAAEPRATGSG